jgi:hypothetical protein
MTGSDDMQMFKLLYPEIAFKRGDKPKSFFFNVIYHLIWIFSVLAVSGAGFYFISPLCGLGAILSLLMMKGLLDVFAGNTVLVSIGNGSLEFRKTKEKTMKEAQATMRLVKKLSALDKEEVGQKLESIISDVLSDNEENNQEKALAIASFLNMDKNKDGNLLDAEMMDAAYDDILSSFGLEADENSIKANEALADQILSYLDSNPNATSKDIVEKFSNGPNKEEKYASFGTQPMKF